MRYIYTDQDGIGRHKDREKAISHLVNHVRRRFVDRFQGIVVVEGNDPVYPREVQIISRME